MRIAHARTKKMLPGKSGNFDYPMSSIILHLYILTTTVVLKTTCDYNPIAKKVLWLHLYSQLDHTLTTCPVQCLSPKHTERVRQASSVARASRVRKKWNTFNIVSQNTLRASVKRRRRACVARAFRIAPWAIFYAWRVLAHWKFLFYDVKHSMWMGFSGLLITT